MSSKLLNAGMDAVYAWVDGSDPDFLSRRSYYFKQQQEYNLEKIANLDSRFEEVNELFYSIRSVRKFAPWIKNIYVITDRQIPKFIHNGLLQDKALFIIDHKLVFRNYEKSLPTFSSRAIEAVFDRIPNLSEKFIYLNDDFFLVREVEPSAFYIDGKYIFYGCAEPKNPYLNKLWRLLSINSEMEAKQGLVGLKNEVRHQSGLLAFRSAHVPGIFDRSSYSKIVTDEIIKSVLKHKFRSSDQMRTHALWRNAMLYRKQAIIRKSGWSFYMPSTALNSVEQYEKDNNDGVQFTSFQNMSEVSIEKQKIFYDFLEQRLLR
ncbi:stealth family protein [Amylibacter sp.]|nr:stealth family protein [Amylibacter sp.]